MIEKKSMKHVNLKKKIFKKLIKLWISLGKVHKMIKFSQNAWLKLDIDMNTDLRKKAKDDFENDFFKLMNNEIFVKTIEHVTKHKDIKLVTTKRKRNYLL